MGRGFIPKFFLIFFLDISRLRITGKNGEAPRFPLSLPNCPRASLSTATVLRLLLQDNNHNIIIMIIIIVVIIIAPVQCASLCTDPSLPLQVGFQQSMEARLLHVASSFFTWFTRKVAVCVCLCINLENAAFSSKLSNWARCANNTTLH